VNNELVVEKAALKRARKKVQSNVDRIWNLLKSQRTGFSTTPLEFNPNKDGGDDDDGDDPCGEPNLDDGSQSYMFYMCNSCSNTMSTFIFRSCCLSIL